MTNDLRDIRDLGDRFDERDDTMPVLFIGHGNPMNAIEENEFSRGWSAAAAALPRPTAILCISAHWETAGTRVTAVQEPRTIHDFYGFPPELYSVRYPAPGSPRLADLTREAVRRAAVELDRQWGLDHGCWSVVRRMYPAADVPVIQLSLDTSLTPSGHYELAHDLAFLRRRGVLILGSGNIVHNLGVIDWRHPDGGYDWALAMNERFKTLMTGGDHRSLVAYDRLGREALLSVPTPEHYLPLLYILAVAGEEEPRFFNDRTVMGSIAMTSVRFG